MMRGGQKSSRSVDPRLQLNLSCRSFAGDGWQLQAAGSAVSKLSPVHVRQGKGLDVENKELSDDDCLHAVILSTVRPSRARNVASTSFADAVG